MPPRIVNALTVDVEDYFQVSAFAPTIRRSDWDKVEHRIEGNMDRVLQLFADFDVKVTFFMLGWIAERYPAIVHRIVEQDHELASHGYGHQLASDLSPEQFAQDVARAKGILEDTGGAAVRGYRAPSYSIGKDNLWTLETLAKVGHEYSSSIYPVRHDIYGFPEAPRFAFRDSRTGLIEVPVTTLKIMNRTLPAGGGGFFRLYPYPMSRWIIARINRLERQSTVFYFHPWELDPDQPRQRGIGPRSRFRHYLNLGKTENRIRRLIADFDWGRMDAVFVDNRDLPDYPLTS